MIGGAGAPPAEDPVATALDQEIEALRAQAKSLRAQRRLQTTTILSSRSRQAVLSRLRAQTSQPQPQPRNTTSLADPDDLTPLHRTLLNHTGAQAAHNQECLYRTCAGMTTFKVRDPDPKAVDGGSILGLRIEAFQRGKFIRPYYIFLNRPYIASGSRALRVHRHTVPPCIPLAALASRHLPPPPTGDGAELGKAKKQDLSVFARALRTEIANYHNRVACIAHLRKSFGLDAKEKDKGKGPERVMAEISAADAEAKQVRFEWVDGRIGRAVCDSKGRMLKAVVFGEGGRERDVEARMLGGDGRLEGLAERMR